MTPVEATRTSSGTAPICSATSSVIVLASLIPRSPVAAFELPELITTARAVDRGSRSRETLTGAPHTRLVVKTPAAAHGRSETNSARSSLGALFLMPHRIPAVEKPAGRGIKSVIIAFVPCDDISLDFGIEVRVAKNTVSTGSVAIVRGRFIKNVKKFVSVTLDRIAGGLIDSALVNAQNVSLDSSNTATGPNNASRSE